MGAPTVGTHALTRQTDEELLREYSRTRDLAIRNELFVRFMPFARKLALRYVHSREPLDDLVQVAGVGLLNAIERFEPGRGKKFTSFAAPTIMGELKRHFRDKGWSIHVPRDVQESALAVSRQTERMSVRLGRSPTVDELAEALHYTVERVMEALDAAHNYHPASLEAPVVKDGEDGAELGETLGSEDAGFELAEDRQAMLAGWSELTEMERQVLGLRLVHELTQREISERIGCSQMHVSRLLRRALQRLDTAASTN
jgi:RNA polymerase sigma-B factor